MTAEQYAAAYEQSFHIAVRFFLSRGLRHDDAVEAVQAGWAKGWEQRHQLRESGAVVPWVISIAKNLRNTALRHRRPIQTTSTANGETAALTNIDARRLLERSKPEERELLGARYLEGFTVQELAEAAHVSPEVLHSRLNRARRNALARAKARLIRRHADSVRPAA